MLKFFLIKQVQHSYTIEKIKTYWTNKMRDILICEASAAVNLIVSEIDNLLGKNQLDAYSSDSSDESEDSDTGMNRTVDLRKTKNILKNNEPKIREKFKDTSNLNKTSKITTKKMLDQIHNPVITKSALLHSNKIIRVSNSEYNGPYMHKRETDTSTNYSSDISQYDIEKRSSVLFENAEYLSMKSFDTINNNYPAPNSVTFPHFTFEEERENFNIFYRKSREILYISIDLLLKKIAIENYFDENIISIRGFIKQYNLFMKTDILIDKITSLYNYFEGVSNKSDKIYPVGIVKFVNEWVILRFEDEIRFEKKTVQKLKNFYDLILTNTETFKNFDFAKIEVIMELFELDNLYDIKYNIERVLNRKKFNNIPYKTNPILPDRISDIFDILQWSEVEIARQLCLYSHQLYSKIEYHELLSARWTKSDKFLRAPTVMKTIDRFNKLSLWIMEEILSYDKKIMRAKCIEKFIKVAVQCEKLGNYSDLFNITTTLGNYIIKNLNKTWSLISSECLESLQRINAICSYENNYGSLRSEMAKFIDEVSVPHLGPMLKELAYFEEGPKYVKNEYLVNMTKINSVAKSIDNFLYSLRKTYTFKQLEELTILMEPNPKSEEEIEELANKIEPKFTLKKTKSTQKRVTNTDSKNFKLKPSGQEFLLKSSKTVNEIIQIDDHF